MNQIKTICECNKCNNSWEEISDFMVDDLCFTDDELAYHLLGRFYHNDKLINFLIKYNIIPNMDYCQDAINIYNMFMPIRTLEDTFKMEILAKLYKKYSLIELEKMI